MIMKMMMKFNDNENNDVDDLYSLMTMKMIMIIFIL